VEIDAYLCGDKNYTWILVAVGATAIALFMVMLCCGHHHNHKERFAHFREDTGKDSFSGLHHTYPSDDSSTSDDEFDEGSTKAARPLVKKSSSRSKKSSRSSGSGSGSGSGSDEDGSAPAVPELPELNVDSTGAGSGSGSSDSGSDGEASPPPLPTVK